MNKQIQSEKVLDRKGKSPENKLRSQNTNEVEKENICKKELGGGTGSSHPLKKA